MLWDHPGPGYSGPMIRSVRLERTVRFAVSPTGHGAGHAPAGTGVNGFGGAPAMHGVGRHYELDVACEGEPDAATGYLINIKDVDRAVHDAAVPVIVRACADDAAQPVGTLREVAAALRARLPIATRVRWRLSPTYAVEMTMRETGHAVVRQQFDFAAAHRLHVPSLSDAENRAAFGKCNNPRGHGHNYRIEVALRVPTGPSAAGLSLADFERLVQDVVIERFDHKHLNEDTAEFATGTGLNPSVENIAMVCFDLLDSAVRERLGSRGTLAEVTVWETDRTSATYSRQPA